MKYLFLILLLSLNLFSSTYQNELINRAIDLKLYEKQEWLKILRYKKDLISKYRSVVDDDKFFLSQNGKTDPKDELIKTLISFFDDKLYFRDMESKCIFISRFKFLDKWLEFDKNLLNINNCQEYINWFNTIDPKSLTLVFPSSYMNNPSSMFGHTFLRINKKNNPNKLLDYSVNFAAITGDDGGLEFAIKGVFGKYGGYYTIMPYFEKTKEYGDIESRDIWEYDLVFDEHETKKIVESLWEIHFFRTNYYFFKENCSYNLLFLLESAREDLNLTNSFQYVTIPVDSLKIVIENNLTSNIVYRASRLTKSYHETALLDGNEITYIKNLINRQILAKDLIKNTTLSKDQKISILEVAYEVIDFKRNESTKESDQYKNTLFEIMQQRSKLGSRTITKKIPPIPKSPPHKSHKSKKIEVGYEKDSLFFSIKPSYHNWNDKQDGYLNGAWIDFLKLKTKLKNNIFLLDEFTILDIRSLSAKTPYFMPFSWAVDFGYKRDVFNTNELVFHNSFGVGFSFGDKDLYNLTIKQEIVNGSDLIFGNSINAVLIKNINQNLKIIAESKITKYYENRNYLKRENLLSFIMHKTLNKSYSIEFKTLDLPKQYENSATFIFGYNF